MDDRGVGKHSDMEREDTGRAIEKVSACNDGRRLLDSSVLNGIGVRDAGCWGKLQRKADSKVCRRLQVKNHFEG